MRVRWTTVAFEDLAFITSRIRADNPAAAAKVAQRIYRGIELLSQFPFRGRMGKAPGTRELVFPPWPYIVVYEVVDDCAVVIRIRDASQEWPRS